MSSTRKKIPQHGLDWKSLADQMQAKRARDVDWQHGRAAVYIFNAGEDVMRVAREAYGLFQAENGLGPLAFPSLRAMEEEIIDMGLDLLHGPASACGNMTSGGTESILLAVKTCRDQAASRNRNLERAHLVVPYSAHPAFDKACQYFGLGIRRAPLGEDRRASVAAMAEAIDGDTLMLVGSAPCFPYGLVDPIEELSELALKRDLWFHVDACVGAYFLPFARMNGVGVPAFDFELPGVASISGDLHKYGYASKGASTLFHRSEEQRAHQIFSCDDWPAGHMSTPTLAGTRPGGAIASAWAVIHYLGEAGYREKAREVCSAREQLTEGIEGIPELCTYGEPNLSIMLYGSTQLDAYALYGRMIKRGWFSGVVTDPRAVHLMLAPCHASVADEYLADLQTCIEELKHDDSSSSDKAARYN